MFSKVINKLACRNGLKLGRLNRLKSRGMSSSHAPALKEATYNDILIPHEPFEVGYKKRQVGNNVVLVLGIVFFALTNTYVWNTGVINPNLTPPKKNLPFDLKTLT